MSLHLQFGWGLLPGITFPLVQTTPLSHTEFLQELDNQIALLSPEFESAWLIDHLQFDDGDLLEAWSMMSYFMGKAPQLHFGNMVLCQSFRNPALLAKMAATLQYLSQDRLYLGIGAGWKEDEYRAYGFDFPPSGVRVTQLDEAINYSDALVEVASDVRGTALSDRERLVPSAIGTPPTDYDRRQKAAHDAPDCQAGRLVEY